MGESPENENPGCVYHRYRLSCIKDQTYGLSLQHTAEANFNNLDDKRYRNDSFSQSSVVKYISITIFE